MGGPDAAAPVAPFVQQLFKLVTEGMHIHWAADGAALVIPDTAKFAADRCPVYFKHSNWTSFARMLNMYEFRRRKSADGSAIFAHPHFTRDGARLARVVRKKRASSSSWEDVDALWCPVTHPWGEARSEVRVFEKPDAETKQRLRARVAASPALAALEAAPRTALRRWRFRMLRSVSSFWLPLLRQE